MARLQRLLWTRTGTTSRMRKPSCVHLRTSSRNTAISSYVSSPWPWPTMGNFGLSTCSTLMFAGPSGVSRAGRSRRSTRLIRLPGTHRTMPSDLRRVNSTFAGSAPCSTSCAAEKERFQDRRTVMATDGLAGRTQIGTREPSSSCLTPPGRSHHVPSAAVTFPAQAARFLVGSPGRLSLARPGPPRPGCRLRACRPAGRGTEVVLACNILNRMTALGRPASYRIGR